MTELLGEMLYVMLDVESPRIDIAICWRVKLLFHWYGLIPECDCFNYAGLNSLKRSVTYSPFCILTESSVTCCIPVASVYAHDEVVHVYLTHTRTGWDITTVIKP